MNTNKTSSLLIGIIIIIIGAIFLAINLNYISKDFYRYIFNWYSWMLYVGPIMMINKKNRILGAVFFGIGVIVLLGDLGLLPAISVNVIWPLIIIGVGINIIYKSRNKSNIEGPIMDGSGDFIQDNFIFSGGEFNVQKQNFKGGKINCIFGGGNYNFHPSKLSSTTTNVLDINCIFGGVKLSVPNDWNVKVESTSIFGAMKDERRNVETLENDNPEKTLFITGNFIFGGGNILN